jgi:hypothetical protein
MVREILLMTTRMTNPWSNPLVIRVNPRVMHIVGGGWVGSLESDGICKLFGCISALYTFWEKVG